MMRGAKVAANSAVCRVSGVSFDDRIDVFGEAHVEHLVGFVEHEHLDETEVERLAAQVIEHAARRADDDFSAAPQRADLVIHRRAAVDRHDVQVRSLRVLVEGFGDLHRQLARRHQHQRADLAAAGLLSRDSLSRSGKRERRGLAGAGRGLARACRCRRAGPEWLRVESVWVLRSRARRRRQPAGPTSPSEAKPCRVGWWTLHPFYVTRF